MRRTTLVSCVMAMATFSLGANAPPAKNPANPEEAKAAAAFQKLGATVTLDPKTRHVLQLEAYGKPVTDDDLLQIKAFPLLTYLSLCETKITDAGLASLKGLAALNILRLSYAKITDQGVGELAHLPKLDTLELVGTAIGDAGLIKLKGLNQLRTLDLNATRITDDGMVALKDLPQLKKLYLDNTKISGKGLEHLRGTNLEAPPVAGTARPSRRCRCSKRWQLIKRPLVMKE